MARGESVMGTHLNCTIYYLKLSTLHFQYLKNIQTSPNLLFKVTTTMCKKIIFSLIVAI